MQLCLPWNFVIQELSVLSNKTNKDQVRQGPCAIETYKINWNNQYHKTGNMSVPFTITKLPSRWRLSRWFSTQTRNYAVQAPGRPTFEVFNRTVKHMQKDRAARDVEQSRQVDYIKDEVAKRLCERLLVRLPTLFLINAKLISYLIGYKKVFPEHSRPRRKQLQHRQSSNIAQPGSCGRNVSPSIRPDRLAHMH